MHDEKSLAITDSSELLKLLGGKAKYNTFIVLFQSKHFIVIFVLWKAIRDNSLQVMCYTQSHAT